MIKRSTTIFFLITIFCAFSCGQEANTSLEIGNKHQLSNQYKVKRYQYKALSINEFFKALTKNHLTDFYQINKVNYNQFCKTHQLLADDSLNIEKYFTIKILHDLFTSQTASNCSKGEILNIPYQWHWVSPNPRHAIYFLDTKQLLSKTKPPLEFNKYNSYADIDRTPYLFLSDLVNETPKYYSASCDTFSTFGWCSEREMAFVALTKLVNYEGKVVAEGNHSWSEFVIKLKKTNGEFQNFKFIIDNTFNSFECQLIKNEEIAGWKLSLGNSSLAGWYNKKAKSSIELQKVSEYKVSQKAMARIEDNVVSYLNTRVNNR
jgi:hypothetical protein